MVALDGGRPDLLLVKKFMVDIPRNWTTVFSIYADPILSSSWVNKFISVV